MTFSEAINTCLFKKYANFEGTASRSEYWWFYLSQILASIAASIISQKLNLLVALVFLLPSIAAGTRRLHDTDRSGWLQLLAFLPIIGWIALLIFFTQDSKPNRYASAPADVVHVV